MLILGGVGGSANRILKFWGEVGVVKIAFPEVFFLESPKFSKFSTLGFFGNIFEGPSLVLKIVILTLSYYQQV